MDTNHEATMAKHLEAEKFRENGQFLDALKTYQEVLVSYQKNGNYNGVVESLGGIYLTFKHLFLASNDTSYLHIAGGQLHAAMEIATKFGLTDKFHSIYFWLGEIEILFGKYSEAISFYHKAISHCQAISAQKGNYIYHLGAAQYKDGDKKTGKKNILSGIDMIKHHKHQVDVFTHSVWLSGAYKTLAELLWPDDIGEAKKYLEKAEIIIKSDNRLIIRKRQLQELKEKLLR